MKKIIYSILVCLPFVLGACEKTSEDTSVITNFVTLERLGDEFMILSKGESYVEPGYYAEMEGEDVTADVVVTGSVDTNTPGIYNINYEAFNADGFAQSFIRTIYVTDPTPSPIQTGVYTVMEGSQRTMPTVIAFSGYEVVIYQKEPGIFYISDFLGGWYDVRTGYGPDFAMTGHFQLNADNTITALDSSVVGFGDSMDEMTAASFDSETGLLKWNISYGLGAVVFDVILKK